jgi:hypothetical protein
MDTKALIARKAQAMQKIAQSLAAQTNQNAKAFAQRLLAPNAPQQAALLELEMLEMLAVLISPRESSRKPAGKIVGPPTVSGRAK